MAEESNCTHNCSTCNAACASRIQKLPLAEGSKVKKVIGVMSGKGGVGKSLVTSLLASTMSKKGFKVAILDADITGPSIPTSFGLKNGEVFADEKQRLIPVSTKSGIQILSSNFLVPNETDPFAWRGSKITGLVTQFWKDTLWNDVDFMFVDMPPGTGDVPLTVCQMLPVDGVVLVASPQELVKMIVEKSVKFANLVKAPIIGLVENMSYVRCPDCGKEIHIFGKGKVEQIALDYHIPLLAKIPIDPKISEAVDAGKIEEFNADFFDFNFLSC